MNLKRRNSLWLAVGLWASLVGAIRSDPVEIAKEVPAGLPRVKKVRQITEGPKHHFCACYYGICPWDSTGRYLVVLETNFSDRLPTDNDKAKICLADLQTRKLKVIAETSAWNFQQGAMVHWLGTAPDREIIYNDRIDGKLVSVILDVHSGKRRVLSRPVAAVAHDGKTAISVSFDRLAHVRADYGYAGGQDEHRDKPHPKEDGLFLIDLTTGESKLILSLDAIWNAEPLRGYEMETLFVNHVLFNRTNDRLFFLSRMRDLDNRGVLQTCCMTVDPTGANVRCVLPYAVWGGSHYDWLDDRQLVVTRFQPEQDPAWVHLFFTDGKPGLNKLAPDVLTRDGHCHFSPDGRWLVTDSYPDAKRMQDLYLLRLDNKQAVRIARLREPPSYRGGWRCDLHPRWSRDSKQICIDSTHDDTRQVYIVELDFPSTSNQ